MQVNISTMIGGGVMHLPSTEETHRGQQIVQQGATFDGCGGGAWSNRCCCAETRPSNSCTRLDRLATVACNSKMDCDVVASVGMGKPDAGDKDSMPAASGGGH